MGCLLKGNGWKGGMVEGKMQRNMWMGKDKVNGKNLEIYERDY